MSNVLMPVNPLSDVVYPRAIYIPEYTMAFEGEHLATKWVERNLAVIAKEYFGEDYEYAEYELELSNNKFIIWFDETDQIVLDAVECHFHRENR